FLAAVEQVQRLGDPAGILVVVEGDRLAVEEGVGVDGGVLAVGDGDAAEVRAGGAVDVHVAAGDHGHLGGGSAQAVRVGPARVDARGGGGGRQGGGELAETRDRALVEGAIGDDHIGHAGGHGHRRLLHGRAGRAAAVTDVAEELQLRNTGGAGDGGLGVVVHGERGQTVHIGGRETGVGQRGGDGLRGQAQFAAAGSLGGAGRADARDGGPAA